MIEAALTKRFGVREVLKQARIAVKRGTVHALVGENGAGKSTLVKIIAGVLRGDEGTLVIDETNIDVAQWNRKASRAAGIGIVQQHGAFAGTLSVVENAVLGIEPRRGPVLDLRPTAQALKALGDKIGLPLDPWARTDELSLGAAQRAEIVAALHHGAKLLVLDEPTAVLAPVEVEGLLATLRKLAAEGTTIVIVTHKLDEVRAVADDVTVLRAGETVATFAASRAANDADGGDPDVALRAQPARLDVAAIAHAMVGADLPEPTNAPAPSADAKSALVLEGVGVGNALRGVGLTVRRGEIVGVAGVDGNGQRELVLAIAGLVAHRGAIRIAARDIGGKDDEKALREDTFDISRASPRARLAAGLAHIPEDRHHGGLVLDATVAENITLGRTDITGRFMINPDRVARFSEQRVKELDIRPPDALAIVRSLSGGNQQKVVIARELTRPALAAVIAAQPTRGVDLGAVARIHDQLRAAAVGGAGVLVISADLDELLALCHRIVVLLRGRVVGERGGAALRSKDARSALGTLMTGADAA